MAAWDEAEQKALAGHALGQGLFRPRRADRLEEPGLTRPDGGLSSSSRQRAGCAASRAHARSRCDAQHEHDDGNDEDAACA